MTENSEKMLPRIEALRTAASIIAGERDKQYGSPEDNFDRIARIWSVVLGREVSKQDVAMCMIGLKVARYANPTAEFQADTWYDIAGYAGCGYEVGLKENTAE